MAYTAYRVLKAPLNQIDQLMAAAIAEGWQPLGAPIMQEPQTGTLYQALVQGTPDGGSGGGPVSVAADDITDATAVGKDLLTAADGAAARTAIGAGTSSLALGSAAGTALEATDTRLTAGAAGVATVRAIGSTATTAAAGNHNHPVTADAASGLAAAASVQALAVALSVRIKALEDAPAA